MGPIKPRNLLRHELIGLQAIVTRSTHPGYVGIGGKVIDETKGTLTILDGDERKCVPKETVHLKFLLPDEAIVEVDGRDIVGRPVDRVKKRVKKR
ncbi:MAG: ribonuclease P protein component 1 [Candidatus Bathyarchaeia archaeon]